MRLPAIDLTKVVKLLRSEGKADLILACKGNKTAEKILKLWDDILQSLDVIASELAKGTEVSKIKGPIQTLGKSSAVLASMASQVLSFVPGPVGMVCSFINAIKCFCTLRFPINIGNGLLELLGCIPGGKVAAKGGAKLAPKIEKLLLESLEKNPSLKAIIKDSLDIPSKVKQFARKTTPPSTQKAVKGKILDTGNSNPLKPSSSVGKNINPKEIKYGKPSDGNVSTNKMLHTLSTNTGKRQPYSYLFNPKF